MAAEIETAIVDHVCSITLNRPAKRNALTTTMIDDFRAAVERAAAEPSIRVVVVRAAGASFCAGLDLAELGAQRAAGAVETHGLEHALEILERCPRPTIAAAERRIQRVQGPPFESSSGVGRRLEPCSRCGRGKYEERRRHFFGRRAGILGN